MSRPKPKSIRSALAELADLIKRDGVTTVFYEELVPRDFADALANEAGVKTAVLNPLEGLTKDELAAGNDYVSVMRDNLAALADALGCRRDAHDRRARRPRRFASRTTDTPCSTT